MNVLEKMFPQIFEGREDITWRIYDALEINNEQVDLIDWERFYQFARIVVFYDC